MRKFTERAAVTHVRGAVLALRVPFGVPRVPVTALLVPLSVPLRVPLCFFFFPGTAFCSNFCMGLKLKSVGVLGFRTERCLAAA